MNPTDVTRLVLSAIVTLGFGGVIIGWLMYPPHTDQTTILASLTTALGAGYLQVLSYWFGKSSGS